jgi:transposase
LNSIKKERQSEILKLFKNVKESGLLVKEYFQSHHTPISIRQYNRLKKRYAQQGVAGLEDQRHFGNARKIKPEEGKLVHGTLAYNRDLTSKSLQDELQNQWEITVGQRRIDQLRQQFNLTRIKSKTIKQETVQFAGIEIFSALAQHVGILDHWNRTIQQRLQEVTKTQSQKVSHTKFASITDKVKNKDFSRLSISQIKADNLNRKNLAVLFLPLVTNNGATRNVDNPLGNALRYACGYNYKNATIDKYLRELKYLQVSADLINCNARFWSRFWKQYDSQDHKVACYYIDGNVKPLWSSKRCRKGKVTMLGRVMGCIEQVVIHDGHGRPIYLRLDVLLNEGQKSRAIKSPCSRALIIDGAGNAVQTLRAFSGSDYHYITILDTNQIIDRKFKHLKAPLRYHYGEAFLTDCRVELIDSKDSGYIYESRAVRVQWDNGKECCLVTSIPETIFNASEVVKAYFDRWPFCERQYAMMKAATCFSQVVGYGKKLLPDENMLKKIKKLQTDLRKLQQELKIPLSQITTEEKKLQDLFEKERQLKERSKINKKGKRDQSQRNQKNLESCQSDIRRIQRKIKTIEEPFKKQFNTLRQKSKEFTRIQGKRKVYHVDVELDQLMTSFRLTFANLLVVLAKEILDNTSIEMNTLIQSILFLSGKIEHLPDRRKVYINKNEKDPPFMKKLQRGLSKLNALKICHPSGVFYEFVLN